MSSTLGIQIGAALFFLALGPIVWWQVNRVLAARKQSFQDRGSSWSLGLGTCLSGLPGLEQPALVTCGGTATELIFLDDGDNQEICRIPWSAILDIFGGNEEQTHLHLKGIDAPASLILAQSDHSLDGGRHYYVPSYTVIDWTDGDSQRRQAVFELAGSQFGAFKANYLKAVQMTPQHSLPLLAGRI